MHISENIYSTYYCCVDVCVKGGYTCIMWTSENRFQKSVLCLHYVLQESNFSSEVELRLSQQALLPTEPWCQPPKCHLIEAKVVEML